MIGRTYHLRVTRGDNDVILRVDTWEVFGAGNANDDAEAMDCLADRLKAAAVRLRRESKADPA